MLNLEEAKHVLGMIAGRESGMTTVTINRDAARVILDHLAEQGETEWEYGIAYPRGDEWDTDGVEPFEAEQDARDDLEKGEYLSSDRVVRRRKVGPWLPVTNTESEGKQ